jgi:hypothetical protein
VVTLIVSHRKKFIFLAFNKTGSSSVENALKAYSNPVTQFLFKRKYSRRIDDKKYVFKHIDALTAQQLVGLETWNRYTTFAFVRNPWDRIVSLYHYQNKINADRFPLTRESFEVWLKGGGTGSIGKLMSEFICDEHGNVIVDFVGRFESLEADFNKVCDMIGVNRELPHVNRSVRTDYREYYTDETREIVGSIAQADIEMFGYEF